MGLRKVFVRGVKDGCLKCLPTVSWKWRGKNKQTNTTANAKDSTEFEDHFAKKHRTKEAGLSMAYTTCLFLKRYPTCNGYCLCSLICFV